MDFGGKLRSIPKIFFGALHRPAYFSFALHEEIIFLYLHEFGVWGVQIFSSYVEESTQTLSNPQILRTQSCHSVARERTGMRVQNSGTSPIPYLYCHRGSYKSIYVASVSYRGRRAIPAIGMGATVRIT